MYTKENAHFAVLEIVMESPEIGFVLLCEWCGATPAPQGGEECIDAHGNTHRLFSVEAAEDNLYIVRLPAESQLFGRAYRDVRSQYGDLLWIKE